MDVKRARYKIDLSLHCITLKRSFIFSLFDGAVDPEAEADDLSDSVPDEMVDEASPSSADVYLDFN